MPENDSLTPRELDNIRCYGLDLENGQRITRGAFPIFDRLLNTFDAKDAELMDLKSENYRYKKALEEAIEFLRFRMKDGGLTASDLTLSGILHAACTNQTTNA